MATKTSNKTNVQDVNQQSVISGAMMRILVAAPFRSHRLREAGEPRRECS